MKYLGLSIVIISMLGLSACGGGSSGSSSSGGSSASLSGTASKGIVIGGLVEAFLFGDDGLPDFSTVIASDTTDENGDYSLTIPAAHKDKPIYVRITSDGTATMKCDIAGGCGTGIAFGDSYTLADPDFEMGAVLPETDGSVSIGLTPLTTAAAKKALDSIEMSGSNFGAATLVEQANSSIANTLNDILGLTGANAIVSITDVPIVDLTNPTEVAASLGDGNTAVQTAAINAAVVSAVQGEAGNTGLSIEDAIVIFTDDLADEPLVGNSSDGTVTDLQEILNEAEDVLAEVDAGDQGDALTDALAEVDQAGADAAAEAPDVAVDDTPSPTAGAEELAQVKAFVEELRELDTVIEGKMVGASGSEDSIGNILDNFDIQADAADLASSDDVEASLEALGLAVEAMVEVYANNFDPETGLLDTSLDGSIAALPGSDTFDGITVNVSLVSGAVVLSVVDGNVPVDEFQITAVVNVSATVNDFTAVEDGTEFDTGATFGDEGTFSGSIDLDLAGTSEAGSITVTINAGSGVSGAVSGSFEGDGTLDETGPETGDTFDDHLDATLTNLDMDLNVTIAQNSGTAPADELMTFTGEMGVAINTLHVISDTTESSTNNTGTGDFNNSENEDITITAGIVDLRLAGTFGNSNANFDAEFTLTGDASGVTFREIYDFESSFSEQNGFSFSETDTSTGETESNFVDVSASLTFDANLNGVADAVQFSFDAERTGFDDVEASMSLMYPGRSIMIEATANDIDTEATTASITLSNNDGVVIQLEVDDAEGAVETGTIMVTGDETIYAVLDTDAGIELIRYSDGTFVSAF